VTTVNEPLTPSVAETARRLGIGEAVVVPRGWSRARRKGPRAQRESRAGPSAKAGPALPAHRSVTRGMGPPR